MDKHLDIIVTIVRRGKCEQVTEITGEDGASRNVVLRGDGTAAKHWAEIMGFAPEKDIVITPIQHCKTEKMLKLLSERLNFSKPNGGIAFSIPMSGIGGIRTFALLAGLEEVPDPATLIKKEEDMEYQHEVILTIVNQGHSDDVVSAAKDAGARGATVLYGRGTGNSETEKFFGITIQPEKEIVMMLVPATLRNEVMKTICERAGLNREGKGISFALPVSGCVGLTAQSEN
jgi:nitrogen regulatory protein PII